MANLINHDIALGESASEARVSQYLCRTLPPTSRAVSYDPRWAYINHHFHTDTRAYLGSELITAAFHIEAFHASPEPVCEIEVCACWDCLSPQGHLPAA
ncbi:hypothetical protein SEA_OBLADI_56 [Gordonia phage ObLaDi]|uniref:Uncharacterized protein n=1 Tax=Gordonia phage ObLaDi TaxID=2978487 RepID=A0A977PR18_9CAUD|nr:hypothetical protein SEA_OBLADI_56 [Gordonia phage ObLaDi]